MFDVQFLPRFFPDFEASLFFEAGACSGNLVQNTMLVILNIHLIVRIKGWMKNVGNCCLIYFFLSIVWHRVTPLTYFLIGCILKFLLIRANCSLVLNHFTPYCHVWSYWIFATFYFLRILDLWRKFGQSIFLRIISVGITYCLRLIFCSYYVLIIWSI